MVASPHGEVPGAPKPEHPGDLRNGLFQETWDAFSPSEKKSKISKELNNGRAAMMGIFGLMIHEAIGVDPSGEEEGEDSRRGWLSIASYGGGNGGGEARH